MQVRVASSLFDYYDREEGVLQRGVLSTSLFNIEINDIEKCLGYLTDCSLCLPRQGRETYCFSSCVRLFICLFVTKSCERNSDSFSWIFLKLRRCFCQDLMMCMTFGCNPQISFCYFFHSSDLVSFGFKALRHWVSCKHNSSYSFRPICWKRGRCLCQGLNMCMTFGCTPQIKFCHIFRRLTYSVSTKAYRRWVSCERKQLLLQFYLDLSKTLQLFLSGSEYVHVIGCNTDFLL